MERPCSRSCSAKLDDEDEFFAERPMSHDEADMDVASSTRAAKIDERERAGIAMGTASRMMNGRAKDSYWAEEREITTEQAGRR